MEQTMTNEQSREFAILNRIDELDRLLTITTNTEIKEEIERRKAELRAQLKPHY